MACFERNKRVMLHWICSVKPANDVHTQDLLGKLGLCDLETTIRCRHLCWYGHILHSTTWIERIIHLEIERNRCRGRPRKTWNENVRENMRRVGLSVSNVCHYTLKRRASKVGVVVIIHASHLYDPGSNPGLRMLAEICRSQSDFEGFSPGTPVFLSHPKIDSQLIPSAVVLCSEVVDGL